MLQKVLMYFIRKFSNFSWNTSPLFSALHINNCAHTLRLFKTFLFQKLEETVAENGRLEQELVVLRQKLQVSRRSGVGGTDGLCGGIAMAGGTAALESELWRVQVLVGNLLRQRHELSLQVSQLTEKSNSLSQQMCSSPPSSSPHHYSGESIQ